MQLVTIARAHCSASRSVALVGLDWTRAHDPRLPLGHASIEAALKAAGVKTTGLVYSVVGADESQIIDDIAATGADIVGIGVYAWNDGLVRRLLPRLRARVAATIVVGGPQITYSTVDVLCMTYPDVDAFVRGAGERALTLLATSPGNTAIDGVYRRGGLSSSMITSVDLRSLPSPFLTGVIDVPFGAPMIRWETARGCSYNCTFCAHAGAPEQRRIFRRRREVMRAEIDLFIARSVQRVNVLDPLFNANADHAIAVLDDLIDARFKGEITFQCRFLAFKNRVNEMLDRFAQLNVEIELGLQTTDDIVAAAVGRKNEIDMATYMIDEFHRRRIRFMTSIIYGLPYQTLESFKGTVAWCRERGVPRVRAYPLSLLVGTDLWQRRRELGLVEGHAASNGDVPIVVETPWMARQDWELARDLAEQL